MTDWRQKLVAFLHDPPHKPRAFTSFEEQRRRLYERLGISSAEFDALPKTVDWTAAAADRLVFPNPDRSGLRVDWSATEFEFRHPLGGGILTPARFPKTTAGLEQAFAAALDGMDPKSEDWRSKFIRCWRLWPERSAREHAPHLAYLVADTRIPDHTLWHHAGLASALATAGDSPAFLLFQIGPVQEFIAQARKTADLWSGSYLLSYLIAQGMLAIADEIGPDAIIFPQLRGMPLADRHWWERGYVGDHELRASHPNELLVPNIPNRFLALVPAVDGERIALQAKAAIRSAWTRIASKVREQVQAWVGPELTDWDRHWVSQVNRFPVVAMCEFVWVRTGPLG